MTDTPVTDTSLEALKKNAPQSEAIVEYRGSDTEIYDTGWNNAIDHIEDLIRTGRIRLATPAQKETDDGT